MLFPALLHQGLVIGPGLNQWQKEKDIATDVMNTMIFVCKCVYILNVYV
jgi:hypothetical protein